MIPVFRRFILGLVFNILSWLLYGLVVVGLYFAFIRDFQMNWGATDEDISRTMLADELFEQPHMNATRAVEINAPPEEVWPWVVQIGYDRGGFYGFDNLDNGGRRSSDSILSEFQGLQVGDSIPGGEYKGELFHILKVIAIEPDTEMAWVFLKGTPWGGATWSWRVYEIDGRRSRLVSRLRQKYTLDSLEGVVAWSMIDAIEILMMRTTLRGIKLRAERERMAAGP